MTTPLPPLAFTTTTDVADFAAELRRAVASQGMALIQGLAPERSLLQGLLNGLHHGTDLAKILQSSTPTRASASAKASHGMFALPLHRDGALVGHPTSLIAFASDGAGHGEPGAYLDLVDSTVALNELSADLRTALENHPLHYRVPDRRPFPSLPEGWFTRPTFLETDGRKALSIILPTESMPTTPWEVRVSGVPDDISRQLLDRLDTELRASSTFTRHFWQSGDIVVIDNARILHGASAVIPNVSARTFRESLSA